MSIYIEPAGDHSTNPFLSDNDALSTASAGVYAAVMTQREEILRAFTAKYGLPPDEVEQVERRTGDSVVWYVRPQQRRAQ